MYINWSDKKEVLEAVKTNGEFLQYTYVFRDDKEVVLEAVKQNGKALQYAGKELKNDAEIVMEAVHQNGAALQYASKGLRNNPEIVIEAVKRDGVALHYAEYEMQNDKKVVLESVKKYAWSLKYASEDIKKLVGNDDSVEVLEFEIGKEKSILMANDFRAKIDSKQLEELHALVLEKNKTVVIPDTYITEANKPKDEVKSQSHVEIINHQPVVAQHRGCPEFCVNVG